MPHIIIEHTEKAQDDFNLNEFSQTLHNQLATFETVTKAAIKTRTLEISNVFVGEDETDNKMVHITVLLLAGRPQELKDQFAKAIYDNAKALIDNQQYTLTVEIRDLATYYKG